MDIDISSSAALDSEKALAFAAVAAVRLCERAHSDELSGARLLRDLMNATAWTARARAHHDLPPLSVHELVGHLETPVSEWLPLGPSMGLVDEGEATPLCEEMAEDAGFSPSMEVEQRVLLRAMDNLGVGVDASAKYTAFRRFLVTNAAARQPDAARAARAVSIDLADLYQAIPPYAVLRIDGEDRFFRCPNCGWPMKVTERWVRCASSGPCRQAGVDFARSEHGLRAVGKFPPSDSIPTAGWAALHQGIWRFTTLPGLEELDLEQRLTKIVGVDVVLWPFVDRYDLDVSKGPNRWRVDVKDHASVARLARLLIEKVPAEPLWIVVPDRKREQVPLLRYLVPPESRYRFASSSEFIRTVRAAS